MASWFQNTASVHANAAALDGLDGSACAYLATSWGRCNAHVPYRAECIDQQMHAAYVDLLASSASRAYRSIHAHCAARKHLLFCSPFCLLCSPSFSLCRRLPRLLCRARCLHLSLHGRLGSAHLLAASGLGFAVCCGLCGGRGTECLFVLQGSCCSVQDMCSNVVSVQQKTAARPVCASVACIASAKNTQGQAVIESLERLAALFKT